MRNSLTTFAALGLLVVGVLGVIYHALSNVVFEVLK